MEDSLWSISLLAEIDRFAEMGRQLRTSDGSSKSSGFIIVTSVLVGLSLIGGGVFLIVKKWVQTPNFKKLKLFQGLCRTHGLNRRDRSRLLKLARAQQLENFAEVFVRPELFDSPSGSDNDSSRDWMAIMKLRDRLFARRLDSHVG